MILIACVSWHSPKQHTTHDMRACRDPLIATPACRYELPPVQIAKSLVYLGPNYRLRRVVHDLMRGGKTIRVGAIGGSITHGAKASRIQGENGTGEVASVDCFLRVS